MQLIRFTARLTSAENKKLIKIAKSLKMSKARTIAHLINNPF